MGYATYRFYMYFGVTGKYPLAHISEKNENAYIIFTSGSTGAEKEFHLPHNKCFLQMYYLDCNSDREWTYAANVRTNL